MKINRIMKAVAACMISSAMLAGCSDISFGEQTLLRPPRATGDKAEIQTVIKEQAGSSYMLKYPQSGDYRSAVTMFEAGKDNKEYAVALYSTENDSKLNISVIAHDENKWECLGSFSNAGTGVDRIMFEDINNDGDKEILIGWSTYNSVQNTLSAYALENDTVREMAIDESYTELVIADITQDKSEDIVLLSLRNNQTPSTAKVLQYSEQEKRPIGKFVLELDSDVTAFANVECGKISGNKSGIVIDGEKSGGLLTTQVLWFDTKKQELCNPLVTVNDAGTLTNVTTRKDVITSRDIDDDGIIEVPVVSQMSAPTDTDASTVCSVTSWRELNTKDGSLNVKLNTVMNYTDGYYFVMPESWSGSVTAISDAENRRMDFYIWSSKTSSIGDKLLSVYRFTGSEWNKAEQDDFVMINGTKSNGTESVIAAEIFHTDSKDELNISKKEVKSSIVLIA